MKRSKNISKVANTLVLGVVLVAGMPVLSHANNQGWQPISSERLVRLPASYLDKAVERDFRESALADRLIDLNGQAQSQGGSLAELREAIGMADGEQRMELRHQFMVQKSAYLDSMEERQKLHRKELLTKVRVYESVLSRLRKDRSAASDPVVVDLIAQQKEARQRLATSVSSVDAHVFDALPGDESKYTQQYGENLAKISELQSAILQHPANDAPSVDGEEVTREDFVRHLIAQAEAGLALLDQEEEMLGYMARLVALDAQALQNELEFGESSDDISGNENPTRLANAVDFFTK